MSSMIIHTWRDDCFYTFRQGISTKVGFLSTIKHVEYKSEKNTWMLDYKYSNKIASGWRCQKNKSFCLYFTRPSLVRQIHKLQYWSNNIEFSISIHHQLLCKISKTPMLVSTQDGLIWKWSACIERSWEELSILVGIRSTCIARSKIWKNKKKASCCLLGQAARHSLLVLTRLVEE
jgi:hypothetical protein